MVAGFVVVLIIIFLVLMPLTIVGVLFYNHRRGLLDQPKHRIRYGMLYVSDFQSVCSVLSILALAAVSRCTQRTGSFTSSLC
jgi:hypothetical protein